MKANVTQERAMVGTGVLQLKTFEAFIAYSFALATREWQTRLETRRRQKELVKTPSCKGHRI